MICGSGGSKSRLAKAAGAEPCGQMRDESCTPLWREAHLQVKKLKFGSWDVEKVHAIVARSTFPSQNVQNTPFSDHFWKLRCWKSARRCGAKHISQVMYKTHHVRTAFGSWDVEKVHAVVGRSTFRSQQFKKLAVSEHFWKLRCRNRCGAKHISKSKVGKTEGVRSTFGRSDVVSRGRHRGLGTLSKVSKTWGLCSSFSYNHHNPTLHYTTPTTSTSTTTITTWHYTTLHYTTLH